MPDETLDYQARQAAILPAHSLSFPVHLIGAGGVGSLVALLLAKLGVTDLHLYDDDTVVAANVGTQVYGAEHIGSLKVDALAHLCEQFAGIRPQRHAVRVARLSFSGLVIAAVDSMRDRRAIFEQSISGRAITWFLDVRLGFAPGQAQPEMGLLFALRPLLLEDCAAYARSLYDDANTLGDACGSDGIIYASTIAAGKVVRAVKQLVLGEEVPFLQRILP